MANVPNLVLAAGNEYSSTLSSLVSAGGLSISVNDTTGLNTAGGELIIDEGVAGVEEVIYYESIAGTTLTIATNGRGRAGTTGVGHAAGATITDILVDEHINGPRTAFLVGHNDNGTHKNNTDTQALSNKTITASTINSVADNIINFNAPQGFMINGKIVTSVSSNNLTIAIKTLAGNDPSANDPVFVRIGDTMRTLTSAKSVTINAGVNTFGSGAAETATKDIDYFAYLIWKASDSSIVLGVARKPGGALYSDFSGTATNNNYIAVSATPAATDVTENIGRFNAILGATASFNWSIGTSLIISRPIFSTRILSATSTITANAGTITTVGTVTVSYWIDVNGFHQFDNIAITTIGTASGFLIFSLVYATTNATQDCVGFGTEHSVGGKLLKVEINGASAGRFYNYDNSFNGANSSNYGLKSDYLI